MIGAASKRSAQIGFTFVELLVTIAILMFILLAAYNVIDTSQRVTAHQEEIADMDSQARVALDIATSELRLAGRNILKLPELKLTPIGNNFVIAPGTFGEEAEIRMDLDGDGATNTNGLSERVRYSWTNVITEPGGQKVGNLVRSVDLNGNGSFEATETTTLAASVLRHLNSEPVFRFYDQFGVELVNATAVKASCRSIAVQFAVRSAKKDRVTRQYRSVTVRDTVVLRNIHRFPS